MIYMNSTDQSNWVISLQKDGTLKSQELDFFKRLGFENASSDVSILYYDSDGSNIIFGYQEVGDYGRFHYYKVTYPKN